MISSSLAVPEHFLYHNTNYFIINIYIFNFPFTSQVCVNFKKLYDYVGYIITLQFVNEKLMLGLIGLE